VEGMLKDREYFVTVVDRTRVLEEISTVGKEIVYSTK
jgi:hypothetical protein